MFDLRKEHPPTQATIELDDPAQTPNCHPSTLHPRRRRATTGAGRVQSTKRCLARVDPDGAVALTSRRRKPMHAQFPEIRNAVHEYLPRGTVVDGEIVRWVDGRLDFAALQHRYSSTSRAVQLATSEPCHYIVFDVLELDGEDLREQPLAERRNRLEDLFADIPGTSPLQLGLHTSDRETAQAWAEQLAAVGVEGLIVKAGNGRYRPGSRDWLKVKNYATTEALIGGVTGPLEQPAELILGRYTSAGELTIAGRTTPLSDAAAAQVAAVITPAGDDHPWPTTLPPSWHSRGRERTEYTRIAPTIVVEVRVDVATHGQRWRHGLRFLRPRPDLGVDDVPRDLDLET